MAHDRAWNLQSTLGQGARNVLVLGLLCQPCAGESCIGPEHGCVSVLFSIYGSELQSGLKRSVHPPPGRALTHQAADSRSGGPGGATHSCPHLSLKRTARGRPQHSPAFPAPRSQGTVLEFPSLHLKTPPPHTHTDC